MMSNQLTAHRPACARQLSGARAQRGATMIEILVAFILMTVGMLGILGMRLMTERAAADSNLRSTAAMHAQDMFERLRANPTRAGNNEYNLAIGGSVPTGSGTIAVVDLAQWYGRLAQNLPGGTGTVAVGVIGVAPTAALNATVTVQWTERAPQSSTGNTVSFTFASRL